MAGSSKLWQKGRLEVVVKETDVVGWGQQGGNGLEGDKEGDFAFTLEELVNLRIHPCFFSIVQLGKRKICRQRNGFMWHKMEKGQKKKNRKEDAFHDEDGPR